MLGSDEVDYLLQATQSAVKRYGGDQPSLSHLAQVLSSKWQQEFTQVFGADGPEHVTALLRSHNYVGDEEVVRTVLKAAEDRQAVLIELQTRLQPALEAISDAAESEATAAVATPKVDPGEAQKLAAENEDWPSRTRRFVAEVAPRDDLLERDAAVEQIISVLSRTRHRLPIVLGQTGVGRTSLMGGVAARLAADNAGKLWRVAPGRLGPEPEEALVHLIGDCGPDAVLVIDDVDKVASLGTAHPSVGVLRILSAAAQLEDHRLILICETRHFATLDLLAEDLPRQLVPIRLATVSESSLTEIVERAQPELAKHYGVKISPALRSAACTPPNPMDQSVHPGLAVDRLDIAASRARVAGDKRAEVSHLASSSATHKRPLRAKDLHDRLSAILRGQDHAVSTVASRLALTLARLDLHPGRPDGVFLFVGPTGVGKTKLARALSLCIFGSEERLIRLDMSEYAHDWSVSRLVGPMPGYVGSTEPANWLTTKVSAMPDCVVLLDEIEKAHPVVWNTFLQVFDAGRLTDSRGITADFSDVIIVMTSNLGAAAAAGPGLGFGSHDASVDRGRQKIISAVKEAMAPELINRIDELVVFDLLSMEAIREIAEKELAAVTKRLAMSGWSLSYEQDVVDHIAESGYDPAYGARHLQRNIERVFLSLVARSRSKVVHVSLSDGQLTLRKGTRAAPSPE